jgi:CBS domain containing-hemolysin-like protein
MKELLFNSPVFFITLIVILIILALFSAFFSASETALIALSRIRLRHYVQKKMKRANVIQEIVTHLDRLIATILVGNNFVNTAITTIAAFVIISFLGPRWGVLVSTLAVTIFLLIFCEITPKIFATKYTERVCFTVARPMRWLINFLAPIVNVITKLTNHLIKMFGGELPARSPLITEEEIRMMIEIGKEEGVLGDEERKMLHRIFEFGDTKVSEVMMAKDEMVAVDIKATSEQLLELVTEEGHSRFPVYEGDKGNIKGVIYARDLLHIWRNDLLIIVPDLVHPAYFIDQDRRVSDLLRDFQQKHIQIAIVTDKEQKALGLVTLEDLIEEIVGEIEDDSRENAMPFKR